jgi:hypothetical protein
MKTAIYNFPSVCKTKFWKFILAAATNTKVIHCVCSLKVVLNTQILCHDTQTTEDISHKTVPWSISVFTYLHNVLAAKTYARKK